MELNKWQTIWNKRKANLDLLNENADMFSVFCELKRADGFDVNVSDGYYRNFYCEWERMRDEIFFALPDKRLESIFEVGCGSGVNLYMFQQQSTPVQVGGIDYSKALAAVAKTVTKSNNIVYGEACNIEGENQYDAVISDSVFQYFPGIDYGMKVLEKMYRLSKHVVYISEIYDLNKKEACISHRKKMIENYEEKYQGLDKTFFSKQMFLDFAERNNCDIKFTNVNNESYWNQPYLFNCYIYKKESRNKNGTV